MAFHHAEKEQLLPFSLNALNPALDWDKAQHWSFAAWWKAALCLGIPYTTLLVVIIILLSLLGVVRVSALCTSSSPQQQLAANTAGRTRNSQHLYKYALTCHMSLLFDVLCHYQSRTQGCSSACSPPLAATVHTASYAYPEWPLLLARRVPSIALSPPRE